MTTAAVILAAGRGTRFGGGKMLAQIDGRPMLEHVLDLACAAELAPIVLVLGADAGAISAAIPSRGETRVINPHPERGISSSLSIGLETLATSTADWALVLLGDQPRLGLDQLRQILASERDSSRPIVVPRYDGRPGNPVLLEREAWSLARDLEGDRGMSQLFSERAELVRYVDLTGANPDVDTPMDLAALTPGGAPGRSDRTVGADRNRP